MRRFFLIALSAVVALSACGDAEDPAVVDSDTVIVDTAPDAAVGGDVVEPDALNLDDVESDEVPVADVAPSSEAPPPAALPDAPAATPPSNTFKAPAASELSAVTFFNNTGMSISHLYIAGCDESEGSDWNDMRSWAQERLEGDALDPDESTVIEYADGCYVAEPHYVGGTPISEKVIVDGPTTVDFTIG